MSSVEIFEDQSKRNTLGFDITCQIEALLEMLRNEQRRIDDPNRFGSLLDAVIPRLNDLNNAAMSLFTDSAALTSGALFCTVHGLTEEEQAA